jgi:hypothetical protein
MAKYSGSGWHFQHTRHSNARKYGKAGGRYSIVVKNLRWHKGSLAHSKNVNETVAKRLKSLMEKEYGTTTADFKVKKIAKNKHYGEGIDLKDTTKFKFGSVAWQEAMIHNINEKSKHCEQLSPAELSFLDVEHESGRLRTSVKIIKDKKNYGESFKIKYKGKMIEAEKEETKYFSSFTTYPESEAKKYAEQEMKKNPILTRYTITEHTFQPTSAYPQGKHYEVDFYYHRPTNQYYDYGTDVAGAKKSLAEFIKEKNKPLYPYAVSSVERNMFHSGIMGALDTIKADKKTRNKIEKIFNKREANTPYTNWSGD